MSEDAKYAALFAQFVFQQIDHSFEIIAHSRCFQPGQWLDRELDKTTIRIWSYNYAREVIDCESKQREYSGSLLRSKY